MTDKPAPNIWCICNICGEKIKSVCLFAPVWSRKEAYESLDIAMVRYMEKYHGIECGK